MDDLTHLDEEGHARMVDVGGKPRTARRAVAGAYVAMLPETARLIAAGDAPKGDVLATARIAGIQAAKRTCDLVPLCHPIQLTHVAVDLEVEDGGVRVTAVCETVDRTGVEMEALTAAAAAGLTVYDMLKAADRGMVVGQVRLLSKSGGASGGWDREEP